MGTAKKSEGRNEAWMREHGFTLDADGKMIPAVNNPGEWRELAFAPISKGRLALVPRRPKVGIQAADVPDCSIPLPSVKAELLRFMDEADIKTPEAAVKWRMVYEAANLDAVLLDGVTDELARRCTIRASLHLLARFATFIKASKGEVSAEDVMKLFEDARAENRSEHEKTRTVAKDAVIEKRTRGGQKKEREARVHEAMDKMAKLIRDLEMSIPEAGHEVWEGYVQKKEPLGISESRLINRFYAERGPKPHPRKSDLHP